LILAAATTAFLREQHAVTSFHKCVSFDLNRASTGNNPHACLSPEAAAVVSLICGLARLTSAEEATGWQLKPFAAKCQMGCSNGQTLVGLAAHRTGCQIGGRVEIRQRQSFEVG